jgi:surface protein
MIVTQNKTTTLYSYQNGIGANTEAILNRTLRHILYGDLYVNGGGNGGNGGGGIPSNEMHFTTLAGSVDYVGTQGDKILLSNNSVVDITATGQTVTFNAPSGKHVVKLVESVGRSNYVSVGGKALVELHNFPALSTVTKFNFATHNYNPLPNLTKVPDFLPSNIINIADLFCYATSFNQPLNNWNVSNVTNMFGMFTYTTKFNQPLNNWNVSNVTNMGYMFYYAASFNQDLNNWCVSNIPTMPTGFNTAATFLVGAKLPVWGTCPAP